MSEWDRQRLSSAHSMEVALRRLSRETSAGMKEAAESVSRPEGRSVVKSEAKDSI
jgi:hypothetical protein